ncbi:MAG: hypothetical protein OEW31_12255 [Thermoleophilia bacterium]|nr:hypothetical protein [Thermoleophilia bacterium]
MAGWQRLVTSSRVTPLLVALACAVLSGCGASTQPATEPAPPAEPAAGPTVPDVIRLASGRFRSGDDWLLTWETTPGGRGSLCVRFVDPAGEVHDCTRSSSTWFIGLLRRGNRQIVYATLPCGVASVELRGDGRPLDRLDTVAADDVTLAVLEGPASLDGLSLAALRHDGHELFVLERLAGDPLVPSVGC